MIEIIKEMSPVTLRKKRECSSCLRDFSPGQEMLKGVYSDSKEGKIYNIYQCHECREFILDADREILDQIVTDCCIQRGAISEFLFENGGFTIEMTDQFFRYWKEIGNEQ